MHQTDSVNIGVSSADITPPVGVTLVGYTPRISTGVGHPLRAEAIVTRGADGSQWALVTSDVIGYQRPFVNLVRKKIAERTSLRPEAVLLSATHTHSGPATVELRDEALSELDARYNEILATKLADVVVAAETALKPARFEVAWTEARQLASNRRVQGPDGTWTNEWTDPAGRHTGYVDPGVMLVAVRGQDGKCDALLVNFGCHPVVLGHGSLDISADYVGYMKDALEARGVTATAMFAIAGGANINPRICVQTGPELPRAMGKKLADIVSEGVRDLAPIEGEPVLAHQQLWDLVRTRQSKNGKDRPGRRIGDTIETEIQVLRAGELGMIALGGELFSEYAAMLRKVSPLPQTAVISLANDYIGYLPTDEALAQGAYEADHCPADRIENALMETAERSFAGVS